MKAGVSDLSDMCVCDVIRPSVLMRWPAPLRHHHFSFPDKSVIGSAMESKRWWQEIFQISLACGTLSDCSRQDSDALAVIQMLIVDTPEGSYCSTQWVIRVMASASDNRMYGRCRPTAAYRQQRRNSSFQFNLAVLYNCVPSHSTACYDKTCPL